jgi:hypothetical protein
MTDEELRDTVDNLRSEGYLADMKQVISEYQSGAYYN